MLVGCRACSTEPSDCASYRFESGISPAFRITGAASGEARKRIRAPAASGYRTAPVSAPAKKTFGWSSSGIVPTKEIPGTSISSLTCWKPISASPRATTLATGSPDGGPLTLRLLLATWSADVRPRGPGAHDHADQRAREIDLAVGAHQSSPA